MLLRRVELKGDECLEMAGAIASILIGDPRDPHCEDGLDIHGIEG